MNEHLDSNLPNEMNVIDQIHSAHTPCLTKEIKSKVELEMGELRETAENIFNSKDIIQNPFPELQKNQNNLALMNLQLPSKVEHQLQSGIVFTYVESKHCLTEASNASSDHSAINENDHENIQTRIENYNLSPRIRLGNELFAQNHHNQNPNPPIRQNRQAQNEAGNGQNARRNVAQAQFWSNNLQNINREAIRIFTSLIEFYFFILITYICIYLVVNEHINIFVQVIVIWIYALTQIFTIFRLKFQHDNPAWRNSRKRFLISDWISVSIYLVGFVLKNGVSGNGNLEIILTPFCSLGFLNILVFSFAPATQVTHKMKKKSALLKRFLLWAQILLISLKLDEYLNISWNLILLVSYVTLGFLIVYSIFPLLIFITLVRRSLSRSFNRGLHHNIKLVGFGWSFILLFMSTFWTLLVVGLAERLDDLHYLNLLDDAIYAAFAHIIVLGFLTFIFRLQISAFLRLTLLRDFIVRNRASEVTMEEVIKFEVVEPEVPYLFAVSQTFHQTWKEEMKNFNIDQLSSWRKLIQKAKMSKYSLVQKMKTEPKEKREKGDKLSSSVELVRPTQMEEGEENQRINSKFAPGTNYSCDDIDIEKAIKRPKKQKDEKEFDQTCYICVQRVADAIFMNCGHSGICYDCAMESWRKSDRCVMCRQQVDNILRVKYHEKVGVSKAIHGTKKVNQQIIF